MANPGPPKAKRTVAFYECLDGFSDRIDPVDFDAVIAVVADLDTNTDARFTARDGMELHGRVARHAHDPDLLVVSRLRSSGWPEQEFGGIYSDLALQDGARLAEATHVAFFSPNVVAVLRGPEGPAVARVEKYLMDKIDFGENQILFKPILHPALAERLTEVDYVRRFTMKLPAAQSDRLPPGAPTLRSMFRQARRRFGQVEIEMTIKVPTRGADRESEQILAEIQAIVDSGAIAVLEKGNMTFLNRSTDHGDDLDFLNEKLAVGLDVELRGRSRTVRDDAAAAAIQIVYEQIQPLIARSLGLVNGS